MKTKTKIGKQLKRKTNNRLVETIVASKKNSKWLEIANILSQPTRKRIIVNLDKIEQETKEGDTVLVPGKVLGVGNVSKKIRVVALGFSESAKEKLKKFKGEIVTILEELNKNPGFQGIKIIK